jgi:hypothetical protein
MTAIRFLLPAFILPAFMTDSANAQVVQLPVIGVNSVQTTVSVPDRGSALLGGVSRAAASSNRYGFTPIDSSLGRRHSNASQRVFVTIHDFEEADQILLSAPRRDDGDRPKFRNARAKSAWKQLTSRR